MAIYGAKMFNCRRFLDDVARASEGDYASAFKMLGFVLYIADRGADSLLSGAMVSPRTYYRWVDTVNAAGWASLLADVRIRQAINEYTTCLLHNGSLDRQQVKQKLDAAVNAAVAGTASSPTLC
jgi:ABC-type transport system substrate-binding protein